MSENTALAGDDQIACMLLPMATRTLIMPTVSVAEMAPVNQLQDVADKPSWLMGFYTWRNMKVPVIAYEVLNSEQDTLDLNRFGRIAVLNNTGQSERVPFIALHTQGIPRMARIGPDDLEEMDDAEHYPFDKMSVRHGVERYAIPDVVAIEKAYIDLNLFI